VTRVAFEQLEQLREVPPERSAVATREARGAVGIDRDDRPEPVPLGLVGPAIADGHVRLDLGEHRRRKIAGDRALRHGPTLSRDGPPPHAWEPPEPGLLPCAPGRTPSDTMTPMSPSGDDW